MSGQPTDDADAAARRLYEQLSATAELPLDRTASRVLGEAEAVADDMRGCDAAVQVDRAAVVVDLLDELEGTGNEAADPHLEAARSIALGLADRNE